MKVVEGDMTKNCLTKDLDWMLGPMFYLYFYLLVDGLASSSASVIHIAHVVAVIVFLKALTDSAFTTVAGRRFQLLTAR